MSAFVGEVSLEQEIATLAMERPHLVLLGAGASKAALPPGDRNGRSLPLMREIAQELRPEDLFPADLRDLSRTDFQAACSQLFDWGDPAGSQLDARIREDVSELRLPEEPNLYDLRVGRRAGLATTPPGRTVEVPGGTQALDRSEPVTVVHWGSS